MSVSIEIFGGEDLRKVVRPSSKKKMGFGRLHVLRSTKFYRQIWSEFQVRLGFSGTDDLVQRPVARRRLEDPLGAYRRQKRWGEPSAPTLST